MWLVSSTVRLSMLFAVQDSAGLAGSDDCLALYLVRTNIASVSITGRTSCEPVQLVVRSRIPHFVPIRRFRLSSQPGKPGLGDKRGFAESGLVWRPPYLG